MTSANSSVLFLICEKFLTIYGGDGQLTLIVPVFMGNTLLRKDETGCNPMLNIQVLRPFFWKIPN